MPASNLFDSKSSGNPDVFMSGAAAFYVLFMLKHAVHLDLQSKAMKYGAIWPVLCNES